MCVCMSVEGRDISVSFYRACVSFSTCDRGRWECPDIECSQQCSIIGNQHFTTFDGEHYNYQGSDECRYTLVEVGICLIGHCSLEALRIFQLLSKHYTMH